MTAALKPHEDARRDRLMWHDSTHLSVGDTNFVLTYDSAELNVLQSDSNRFVLGKAKSMIKMMCDHTRASNVRHICEIGIFKGGSAVLYDALFEPDQLVAIDCVPERQPQLDEYIQSHQREIALHPYYGVNQADAISVNAILQRHFPNRDIDLIVDDASHYYEETRATFNIAFPFLRAGGVYIIEDWGWAHWSGDDWQQDGGKWRDKIALSNLCLELVMLCASAPHLISGITLEPAMFIVRRGPGASGDEEGTFDIGDHILARGKAISPRL
jgi:hypothetical protein